MKEKFTPAGQNALENTENEKGEIAGFWRGFWHGLIAPFAFLISLFKDNIGIYYVFLSVSRQQKSIDAK